MKKILVVCFSRTGFTAGVAKKIAKICNADGEEIRVCSKHRNKHGMIRFREDIENKSYVRSIYEAITHFRPAIESCKAKLDDYDCIVLGTPVWAWNIASPVRTFITHNDLRNKSIALFCTYGGGGYDKVLHDMEQGIGKTAIASMALSDKEILEHRSDQKIWAFTNALESELEYTSSSYSGVSFF